MKVRVHFVGAHYIDFTKIETFNSDVNRHLMLEAEDEDRTVFIPHSSYEFFIVVPEIELDAEG